MEIFKRGSLRQGGSLPVWCPEGLVMVTGGREIDIGERITAEKKKYSLSFPHFPSLQLETNFQD